MNGLATRGAIVDRLTDGLERGGVADGVVFGETDLPVEVAVTDGTGNGRLGKGTIRCVLGKKVRTIKGETAGAIRALTAVVMIRFVGVTFVAGVAEVGLVEEA